MNYSSHLVLSMLLKNACRMWYSSIFQKELKDVYKGEGSILMLLWHKLEQLCCSVILVWISSSITQEIILPIFIAFLPSDGFCCRSRWVVGGLSSLRSHFKWAPDSRLCDFIFVPSPCVAGQGRPMMLCFGGEKSVCRLFTCFLNQAENKSFKINVISLYH